VGYGLVSLEGIHRISAEVRFVPVSEGSIFGFA